jgi:hypothetical protein
MATKFVYTTGEFEEITAKYAAGVPIETLALDYSKSVPSIRMKLVKLGVYNKVVKTANTKTTSTVAVTDKPEKLEGLAGFKRAYDAVGLAPF